MSILSYLCNHWNLHMQVTPSPQPSHIPILPQDPQTCDFGAICTPAWAGPAPSLSWARAGAVTSAI